MFQRTARAKARNRNGDYTVTILLLRGQSLASLLWALSKGSGHVRAPICTVYIADTRQRFSARRSCCNARVSRATHYSSLSYSPSMFSPHLRVDPHCHNDQFFRLISLTWCRIAFTLYYWCLLSAIHRRTMPKEGGMMVKETSCRGQAVAR